MVQAKKQAATSRAQMNATNGIDKLTGADWRYWSSALAKGPLLSAPLSWRDHQLLRVAVLSHDSERAGCGRDHGHARHFGQL